MNGDIIKFSDVDTAIVQWDKEYASFIAKPVEDFYFDNDVLGCATGNNSAVEIIRKHIRKSRIIRRRIEMLKINPEKDLKELEKFRIL